MRWLTHEHFDQTNLGREKCVQAKQTQKGRYSQAHLGYAQGVLRLITTSIKC